jgi:hypothetical protein
LDECSKTAKTNYIEYYKRKMEFLWKLDNGT